MTRFHSAVASLAAIATLTAMPARAEPIDSAQKLRQLDIMLMVTGLRCRNTGDDFQADFQAFEANHLNELNAAARTMHADLATRLGSVAADKELDRIGVTMANKYGNGHPWLSCHDLKTVAQDLAHSQGVEPLLAAADELLSGDEAPEVAVNGK